MFVYYRKCKKFSSLIISKEITGFIVIQVSTHEWIAEECCAKGELPLPACYPLLTDCRSFSHFVVVLI